MPYPSLWTKFRWKLQQIHAEGIAGWLARWGSCPLALTDKPAVIVAPHQDDESLGCGGLIALKRERNVPVYLVFLTDGSSAPRPTNSGAATDFAALRKQEALAAAAVLGVDAACVSFLNWPDSRLNSLPDNDSQQIIRHLAAFFQQHQIEEVFVPHRRDGHGDHEAACRLTQAAALQSGRKMALFQYAIWMLWSAPLFFRLRLEELAGACCLPIASVQQKKRRAIQAYQSQCATLPSGFLGRFYRPHELFFPLSPVPVKPESADQKQRPPRILFLDHTGSLGGGQISLLRLLRQLESGHRFDLRVLLFSDGPLRNRIAESGITVDVLPLSPRVLQTSRYDIGKSLMHLRSVGETVRYVLRLAQVIRRSDVDLVHTNSLKSNLIGGIAAALARKNVIWHVHDRIARDYMPASVTHLFRYVARRLPDYVIANSQTTQRLLLGDAVGRSRVIYPGVDVRVTPATPKIRAAESSIVGLVGRISPTKGHGVFLRAIPHILKRFPGTRFRIIGGALFNDANYEKEVHRLADALEINDSVSFTGFIDDVQTQIADLDILVAPSIIPESFGQVLVEGMTLGKPVVAAGSGGALEIIVDGETGRLVAPGDPIQLADVVCSLIEHPNQTQQMARRGRESAVRRFTIESTGREVEQVYQYLLARQETPRTRFQNRERKSLFLHEPSTPNR